MKNAYEEIIATLKKDIQKVNESWWEKLADTQMGREKDVAEIEVTLANEQRQVFSEIAKVIDQSFMCEQSDIDMPTDWNSLFDFLQSKIEATHQQYMPISQHEDVLHEKVE